MVTRSFSAAYAEEPPSATRGDEVSGNVIANDLIGIRYAKVAHLDKTQWQNHQSDIGHLGCIIAWVREPRTR